MKKLLTRIVSFGLILCMAGAMAACSTKSTTESTTKASETETQANSESASAESSDAAFTNQAGKLVMATNAFFPPYEYHDEATDAIMGIDVEIAEAVAKKLGLELVIEDTEFDSIIAGVQMKKYDIGMAV